MATAGLPCRGVGRETWHERRLPVPGAPLAETDSVRSSSAGARGRLVALRAAAAVGAALAGWVAVDGFLTNVARSSATGGYEFFLFWGVPFVAAAAFLGWYAVYASRSATRTAARSGCLAALLVGGAAFLVLFISPLALPWDALRGAVAAFLYAPLAATLGLAFGLVAHRARRRGS